MQLLDLSLRGFRAHVDSALSFKPNVNLIFGPNGAGKTNVLEAIHYLAIGKSFLASKDSYSLRFDAQFFDLKARFQPDDRPSFDIRAVFKPDEGKRIFVNGAPLDRLADVVGRVPIVVFAPVDHSLTDGPPEERRRFLDNTLSQARPAYLNVLMKYRRTLKQRNAVLSAGRGVRPELLAPWNAEFVRTGSVISQARAKFVEEFAGYLDRAWGLIESIGERPAIEYNGFAKKIDWHDLSAVEQSYGSNLERTSHSERSMRRTLVGPHRDELTFRLNGVEVRRYASQGQHRTFGMALKLAKYLYLKETTGESPLLLLDDVFGDLDQHRASVFLELLQSEAIGQSIITTADDAHFRTVIDFKGLNSAVQIIDGSPESDNQAATMN